MNKRLAHIAHLLVILIFPAGIFAQNSEKEPLYFQNYTIEDGLSDNWVRDITQDQQGYIWIATGSGISRFDGYEFEIYRNDPADSTSLSDNDVLAVHADRKNTIWVATPAGIDRFDRSSGTFKRFKIDTGASSTGQYSAAGQVFSNKFHESQNGTLYFPTSLGLAVFNKEQEEFEMIRADVEDSTALSHLEVRSIAESADGRIWIGTYGGGINILNPETGTISYLRHDPDDAKGLPDDYIINIFIDREQALWVSYDRREYRLRNFSIENIPTDARSGLWKKELNTGSAQHYLYNPESRHPLWTIISDFEQTRDGKIWITQNNGIVGGVRQYDAGTDTFFEYSYNVTDPGSLPWNYTTSIHEDRSGHLWVGTSRGLGKADRSQIQMNAFTPDPNDRYNLVNNFYGIEEVGSNHFLISSNRDPAISWNRNTNSWVQLSDIIPLQKPVFYDGRRHFWHLSIENTIARVHIETYKKEIYELNGSTVGSITINNFLYLSDDLLLVATSEGLWKLVPQSGKFTKLNYSVPFPSTGEPDIFSLTVDSSGKVWTVINNTSLDAAGQMKGILLAQFNLQSGETIVPDIDEEYRAALGNGFANHLVTDSRGRVWISKTNGLVRFDPETNQTEFYSVQDGLQHLNVLGILEDNEGMIWISTEYGISSLNPDTGSIKNFGRDDGLRPSRMNAFSFYKRENGELIFGGVGGLSYFHPVDIRESDDPPLIGLVRLEAGETTMNLAGTSPSAEPAEIQWGTNSINLEYVSVNFRSPGQTTYSYKLEGFHEDWVKAGKRRFAQFSNLPPKSYMFHVRAVNADGIASTEAASVSFTVLPPWWRTWWAYGFYLMLLVAGIVAADRIQRRRVQQQEREKAREKELVQAREIEKAYQNLEVAHKDLEQAHSNLKSAQDQLVQQEKLASLGQLTAGIAHEIKNPLNFVNNFSELSLELVEEVRNEIRDLRSEVKSEKAKGKSENTPLLRGDGAPSLDGSARGVSEVAGDEFIDSSPILDILDDIEANLKTIHKHGTRADSIVKSMLQHSRGGDGKMEPTALNPLIKEYVNLAFHGMKAGENPITVDIDLQFDESIGEVPLVAEDFSRVILNLVNNAFDAMQGAGYKVQGAGGPGNEKNSPLEGSAEAERRRGVSGYVPKLTVRTKQTENSVTIEIEDNGPGIPEDIKDKILQPFFTTKKGTQGTGLGPEYYQRYCEGSWWQHDGNKYGRIGSPVYN